MSDYLIIFPLEPAGDSEPIPVGGIGYTGDAATPTLWFLADDGLFYELSPLAPNEESEADEYGDSGWTRAHIERAYGWLRPAVYPNGCSRVVQRVTGKANR